MQYFHHLRLDSGQNARIAVLAPGPLVLQEEPPLLGAWIYYKAVAKFFKIRGGPRAEDVKMPKEHNKHYNITPIFSKPNLL
jgi:hypothetical protein